LENIEEVSCLKRHTGGIPPSTFVRTKHAGSSGVDSSTVIWLKKAHTSCSRKTGEVEIGWPENGPILEGLLGKEVYASRTTKNVYKVLSRTTKSFL